MNILFCDTNTFNIFWAIICFLFNTDKTVYLQHIFAVR